MNNSKPIITVGNAGVMTSMVWIATNSDLECQRSCLRSNMNIASNTTIQQLNQQIHKQRGSAMKYRRKL